MMKSRIWMSAVSIILITSVMGSILYFESARAPTQNGSTPTDLNYVYDYYGGVGLFSEGMHVLATSQDPRTLSGEFEVANDYWKILLETETTQATDQDFISILLSRGDKLTGGYNIQIENFAWLESYPVKFIFQVNFTDPGRCNCHPSLNQPTCTSAHRQTYTRRIPHRSPYSSIHLQL